MRETYDLLITGVGDLRVELDSLLSSASRLYTDFENRLPTEFTCNERLCPYNTTCQCYATFGHYMTTIKNSLKILVDHAQTQVTLFRVLDEVVKKELDGLERDDVTSCESVSADVPDDGSESDASSVDSQSPVESMERLFTLPVELVVNILKYATEEDRAMPMLLSHANSFLRQLVINTPILWTSVDTMDGPSKTSVHLLRSHPFPLDVRIAPIPTISIDKGLERIQAFSKLLSPHVPRIQSIAIESVYADWVVGAIRLLESGDWGVLESLSIKVVNYAWGVFPDPPPCYVDSVLCTARRVSLEFVDISLISLLPKIFSEHVQDLYLDKISLEMVLTGLARVPSLRRLGLKDLYPGHSDVQVSETLVNLGALKSLELFSAIPSRTLVAISAPNLDSFVLSEYAKDPEILTFLRGVSRLRNLEIISWALAWDQWEEVLKTSPSLTRIRLCGTGMGPNYLEGLVQDAQSGQLTCPNLEELVLDNEYELSSDIVKRIVSSRLDGNRAQCTMRSVIMRGWLRNSIHEGDVAEIRRRVEHFVLECVYRDEEEGLHSTEESETEDEDWELDSGDMAVVQGMVPSFS